MFSKFSQVILAEKLLKPFACRFFEMVTSVIRVML